MFKKSLIAVSFLILPLTVSAEWLAGGGYTNLSAEDDIVDVSLGAIYGSAAYEFKLEDNAFSIIPELRIATGISDDDVNAGFGKVNVQLDQLVAFSVRAQYNYDNGVYVYIMPSYADVEFDFKYRNFSESEGDSEFGFGGGVGKKVTDNMRIEASFESFDDTDVLSIGFKYAF